MTHDSLEGLIALFNLGKKREVEAHCKNLVIRSEDFSNVILVASIGRLGRYIYTPHFKEIWPENLFPTKEERMRSINRVPCAIGAGVIGTAKVRWRTAAQRPGNARRQGKSAS